MSSNLPLDHLRLEIAPGAVLSADPDTWPWIDVTGFIHQKDEIVYTSGERDEAQSTLPSVVTLTLDNTDGRFSPRNPLGPWFGLLSRNTPLRLFWDTDPISEIVFVSEWPPRWDMTAIQATAPISADGITRRLDQGAEALNSPLFRSLSTDPNVVAYWPCEDNDGSTSAASPIAGVEPMQLGTTVTFGQSADGLPGSKSSVLIGTDTGRVLGRVPNHTPGDEYVIQLAWRQDEVADGNRAIVEANTTSPDVARWRVFVDATNFVLEGYDPDGVTVISQSEAWHPDLFGRWVRAELRINTDGDLVSGRARLYTVEISPTILNELSGEVGPPAILGRVVRAGVGGGGFPQERSTAHITVLTGDFFESNDWDLQSAFHGYTGEPAATRFARLCAEEGLSCSVIAPEPAALNDNTGFEVDTSGWLTGFGTLTRSTAQAHTGVASGRLEPTGGFSNADATIDSDSAVRVKPGVEYRWSAWVFSPNGWHDVRLYIQWRNVSLGGFATVIGDANVVPAGVWTQLTLNAAPNVISESDARFATAAVRIADSPTSTDVLFIDDAEFARADDSMPMGPQRIDTLIANFRDVEATDGGRLTEHMGGFRYRTRTDLYNQADALTLDDHGLLSEPPEPTDDDQQLRNDVTAQSPTGTSVRAVDQDSVDQLGRYDTQLTVNPETPDQLLQIANWALHLGTVDDMRWPRINLALHKDPDLIPAWLALRFGDRISLDQTLSQLPGIEVDQLIIGAVQRFTRFTWDVTLNCVPASPYDVAVFGTPRFDTAGCALGAGVDDDDTSLNLVSTRRPWVNSTDHAGEFPFDVIIGGERVTITAISGSTSPQTATVTRSVNGIVKSHSSGDAVSLAARPVFAL